MKIIGIETRLRYEDVANYTQRRIEAKMLPFELEVPDEVFAIGDWSRMPVLEFTVHTSRGDINVEARLQEVMQDKRPADEVQKAIEAMK